MYSIKSGLFIVPSLAQRIGIAFHEIQAADPPNSNLLCRIRSMNSAFVRLVGLLRFLG